VAIRAVPRANALVTPGVFAREVRADHNAAVITRLSLKTLAAVGALTLPLLAGAACTTPTTSTSTTGSSTTSALTATSVNTNTTTPSSYATVADLAKALNDKGITCVLEYAGLKDDVSQSELSICTIEDEQATLRVWQGPDLVKKFLASPDGQTGTLAVGGNWTISFNTPETAAKVASALGGSAPGGAATTTMTSTVTPK
jgi:hypothetical protein